MTGYVTIDRRELIDTLVRLAISEDVGTGDWTSLWTVPADAVGRARIVAKEDLVVSGTDVTCAVFREVDRSLEIEVHRGDGLRAGAGQTILQVDGRTRSLLTAERTALNFLAHLSGIATWTRRFVDAVRQNGARIIDTRKTMPGMRVLEKEAVRAGGGENHRMGLHDMVLVKDNHIRAAGGLREAVERVRRHNESDLTVEVEVGSLEELEEALGLEVQRILLDNMDLETLERAVRRAAALGTKRPELEASGNVTLETVAAVAATGVDLVSVGALTHSAPAADVSLLIEA